MRRLLLVPPVLATVLVGCGSSGSSSPITAPASPSSSGMTSLNGEQNKTPQQVLNDAKTAFVDTSSVHLVGDASSTKVDLVLVAEDQAKGDVSVQGAAFSIVLVNNKVYVQAPADAWTKEGVSAEDAAKLSDQWMVLSPGDPGNSDYSTFTKSEIGADFDNAQLGPNVQPSTLDGNPVVVITNTKPGLGSKLYVANTGTPYPLREVNDKGATLDFKDYNASVSIEAPSSAKTFQELGVSLSSPSAVPTG